MRLFIAFIIALAGITLLSAEQRVKFKALHEQWERDRRANSHTSDSGEHRQQD